MTGKGNLTQLPDRRMRWTLIVHLFWMGLVSLLGAWWVRLLKIQGDRIAELERLAGISPEGIESQSSRLNRMLFWEMSTFFLLLVFVGLLLIWLYWRDAQRSRSIQAFFASLTHELKTPLTSIRLQAESLADSLPASTSNPLVQRLLEDTSRLESQVERTLELARVEGGGPVLTQAINLSPWIQRATKSWLENHSDGLQIETQIEDLVILADVAALQVILKNLFENSIRHSKRDTVRVRLESQKDGSWIRLSYRDNGRGFEGDPKTLGKLFQKGPNSQGAGVGLYLVKILMERMGGEAKFGPSSDQSEVQPGQSGFAITLKFREGAPQNG